MPLLLLLLTPEVLGTVIIGGGVAAGIYKASDNISSSVKDNVVPLAMIGAATFIGLRYIAKKG